MFRRFIPIVFVSLMSLLAGARAHAQLSFTLQQPYRLVHAGTTCKFFGDLQNTDPLNSITLDGSNLNVSAPGLGKNNFSAAGTVLGPLGGMSLNLFDVKVPSSAPPHTTILGSYTFTYTPHSGTEQTATQNFLIRIPAVPEMSTSITLGLMLLIGGLLGLRRRWTRPI